MDVGRTMEGADYDRHLERLASAPVLTIDGEIPLPRHGGAPVSLTPDELYGAGRGEGASSRLDGVAGEAGQLGAREWLEELRDLFG